MCGGVCKTAREDAASQAAPTEFRDAILAMPEIRIELLLIKLGTDIAFGADERAES